MRFISSISMLTASFALTLSMIGCADPDPTPGEVQNDAGAETSVHIAPVDLPQTPHFRLIDPTETIDGKTYAEETAAWWKWAISIPKSKNPVEGKACGEGQNGNVFFLAGTHDGKPAQRTCDVPEGKTVFFPLLNSICFPCHEDEGCGTTKTEAELTECAKLAPPKSLHATVDGVRITDLDKFLFTSTQFSFKAPKGDDTLFGCAGEIEENTCGIPKGDRFGVSSGYWLALKDLSKGTHRIAFRAVMAGAAGSSGKPGPESFFVQDVSYDITVK